MSEIDVLLARYRTLVRLTWPTTLSGAERVWFVIYTPAQERRLRLRIADFGVATHEAGHGWRTVDLTDAFARWLAAHEFRDAYFAAPEYLEAILPEFVQTVARQVEAALTAIGASTADASTSDASTSDAFASDAGTSDAFASDENTVVALYGLSALFGLASVSELVTAVRKTIRGRLLLFFPGDKEGSNYRFLDARDGWDYLAIAITAKDGETP
jgi:hypothetical protein